MTRVHARRDLSRLLLPFSSSETFHLPCNLILLLLGLVSVRGVLPCSEKTRPQSHDLASFPYPAADTAERKYSRRVVDDHREWTQHGLNEYEISGSPPGQSAVTGVHDDRGTRRDRTTPPKRVNRASSRLVKLLFGKDDDRSRLAAVTHGEWFHRRHRKRKFRRENDARLADINEQIVDATRTNGVNYRDRKHVETRAKRNFGRKHKFERRAGLAGLEESFRDCEEFAGVDGSRSARRNRSDRIADNPEERGNNGTENPVQSTEANGDLSPASNESVEEPFTGFEGSQKFPIKVTYKPPVAPQVEKFDRRHFGPPKVDIAETTIAAHPSTMSPDLPKSPGRDVLHRHRKVDENTEEERRQEAAIEENEKADEITDDRWLPGASSGRRSSNIAGGKSSPEEKHVSSLSSASPPTLTSTVDDENSANEPRVGEDDREEIEEVSVTVSNVKSSEKINVTILGLFEMTRGSDPRPEGPSELQAARLAVERVNEMNILSNFRLRLIHNDTKVRNFYSISVFIL
ncbi:hypothetical protein K0M31_004916 [Melipona bicolor]|uniref:Uncharacterized protein n=1 Tax=Melipona bicolor TaxID=60889 RepID=A0AA40FWR9_9HYME|nr:hypothetical protein K0M31_004916 [Melipona bicolor]